MAQEKEGNSRRQFLRNTALASLTLGLLPNIGQANAVSDSKSPEACNPTTLD